jgi:hypothetical protein
MKTSHAMLLAAGALLAVPAQAQQLPLPAAQEQAKAVGRYFAQSRECKWSNPIVGSAHGALYGFLYSAVLAQQGKAVADTVEMGSPKAEPCGGPVDTAAREAAFTITFEWLTRLAAAGQMNAQAGFNKDMLRLPDGARGAERMRAGMEADLLRTLGNDQVQAFYQQIFKETSNEFALACDSRKNTSKETRPCPPIPPEAAAFVPLAKARVDAIEGLAGRLDKAFAKEARGEFGNAYQLLDPSNPYSSSTTCRAGNLVIYPDAPDTEVKPDASTVTLRRLARTDNLGRIAVKKNPNSSYLLVDALQVALPELRPTFYALEFQLCFSDD